MKQHTRTTPSTAAHRIGRRAGGRPLTWEKEMKNTIRNASFALVLVALIAGATVASSTPTLDGLNGEVCPCGSIMVTAHTNAGAGMVAVWTDFGNGPELLQYEPVNPDGLINTCFPHDHPNNCIEVLTHDGIEVLKTLFVNGEIPGLWELD